MKVCVDASIIVSYLTVEAGTDAVSAWFDAHEDDEMVAPAFVTAEVASALLKKVRRGQITDRHQGAVLRALGDMDISLIWDHPLIARASELARELGQAALYDCLYLALAEREQCEFWTADARFARAAAARHPRVRLLGSLAAATD